MADDGLNNFRLYCLLTSLGFKRIDEVIGVIFGLAEAFTLGTYWGLTLANVNTR